MVISLDKETTEIVKSDNKIVDELVYMNETLEIIEEQNRDGYLNQEKTLEVLTDIQSDLKEMKKLLEDSSKELDYLEQIEQRLKENQEETISEKNLNELVKVIQKDYEQIEMTSRIVNAYGLLFIPVMVVLVVLYNLLKDFL